MKLIFAGTPAFAATHLSALLETEHDIVAVYTQPDRPAGRGRRDTASAVKQLALQHHLPVHQPRSLRDQTEQTTLQAYHADLMVVVAYGLLLPQAILDAPKYGCINVHASLLPRWRGAAPIQHAILSGDQATGVCIMQMDAGLDTGDVLMRASLPIDATDTSATLHDRLAVLGAPTLCTALKALDAGNLNAEKQDDSLATYAHKIQKQAGNIHWHNTAIEIDRQIRAYNPWPVAFSQLAGETLRIWAAEIISMQTTEAPGTLLQLTQDGVDVQTGQGVLRLTQVQRPNKKVMPAFIASQAKDSPLQVGQRFEQATA